MTKQPLPLITFYKGWETYQHSLVEIIAPLSSEQLALPAASHQWTIGIVTQHMIANRVKSVTEPFFLSSTYCSFYALQRVLYSDLLYFGHNFCRQKLEDVRIKDGRCAYHHVLKAEAANWA